MSEYTHWYRSNSNVYRSVPTSRSNSAVKLFVMAQNYVQVVLLNHCWSKKQSHHYGFITLISSLFCVLTEFFFLLLVPWQGNIAFKEKQWQKAINFYTEAIKLNNKVATYYSNRAAAFLGLARYVINLYGIFFLKDYLDELASVTYFFRASIISWFVFSDPFQLPPSWGRLHKCHRYWSKG